MDIIGVGIDIIEIERIENALCRNARFLDRVFTPLEISYFKSRNDNACHIAGTFAAKEAVLKALGTGLRGIEWKDIEIKRDVSGKPAVFLYKNAALAAESAGIKNIHISISHSRDYALAQAIAEGERVK